MHDTLISYALAKEVNTRTTLDLPEKLLNEAMKITRTGTKTGVIVLALRELIRKSRITDLKKYRGKIDLDIERRNSGIVIDGCSGNSRDRSGLFA
jgi:Arc/MetJ family transcription regulator